jgi:hypothetical protein
MLRKLLLTAAIALQFLAFAGLTGAHDPFPECRPCPFVR